MWAHLYDRSVVFRTFFFFGKISKFSQHFFIKLKKINTKRFVVYPEKCMNFMSESLVKNPIPLQHQYRATVKIWKMILSSFFFTKLILKQMCLAHRPNCFPNRSRWECAANWSLAFVTRIKIICEVDVPEQHKKPNVSRIVAVLWALEVDSTWCAISSQM